MIQRPQHFGNSSWNVLPTDYHQSMDKTQKASNPVCNHLAKQGVESNCEVARATARFHYTQTIRWHWDRLLAQGIYTLTWERRRQQRSLEFFICPSSTFCIAKSFEWESGILFQDHDVTLHPCTSHAYLKAVPCIVDCWLYRLMMSQWRCWRSGLLRCDSVSLCQQFPTFQRTNTVYHHKDLNLQLCITLMGLQLQLQFHSSLPQQVLGYMWHRNTEWVLRLLVETSHEQCQDNQQSVPL
jgi:hypothetical protein